MRVFMTGATGWIGSAVVPELLAAGHAVVGLARSDESAARLVAAGAAAHPGSLDDLDSLRAGAASADAVIHLGFKHDFSDMPGAWRTERAVVETFCGELAGSDRALLLASGVAGLAPGRVATENDRSPMEGPDSVRGGAENLALDHASRGIRSVALRFAPSVHGEGDHGFVAQLVSVARSQRASGYVAGGAWPTVHRLDAGRLVALALDGAPAGSVVHVVGEEHVPTRDIAEAIGHGLGVPTVEVAPDEVDGHFGWIGRFFANDWSASSAQTRELLGWEPREPGLLDDIRAGYYTRA